MNNSPEKSVLVLVGSTRDGFNAALSRAACDILARSVRVATYDQLAELPHFHEGLDQSDVSSAVDEFRAAVQDADGILLITPEYNAGPSSLIKNALDVASRPQEAAAIAGKPVAVIGATPSPGKTARARESLIGSIPVAGATAVQPTNGIAQAYAQLQDGSYSQAALDEITPTLEALVEAVGAKVTAGVS